MTKKHYEGIAKVFQLSLKIAGYNPKNYDWKEMKNKEKATTLWEISKLADYFEKENPKFNREKFVAICKDMS